MALAQIIDHAVRAVARLATQFVDSPLITGLVSALGDEIQTVEDGLYAILLTRDIDNADGATLANIGALVGAPNKGQRTVDQYRNRIKAQVLANRSYGNATAIYQISARVISEWLTLTGSLARIREDTAGTPGYTIGAESNTQNSISDGRDLGRLLDEVSPAGVHAIVLSQSITDAEAFCFEHGPGQGFGDGAFVAAYDGGVKS